MEIELWAAGMPVADSLQAAHQLDEAVAGYPNQAMGHRVCSGVSCVDNSLGRSDLQKLCNQPAQMEFAQLQVLLKYLQSGPTMTSVGAWEAELQRHLAPGDYNEDAPHLVGCMQSSLMRAA